MPPNKSLVTDLGQVLDSKMVTHVPLKLKKKLHLETESDYPKFLGDINWIRPHLNFITAELKPLCNVFQGNSEKSLTPEAQRALHKVTAAISRVM